MTVWKKHKGEIIAAIVGAALTAAMSLGFGLYSLTTTLKYQQNAEALRVIGGGIAYLQRVERDLDENIALMSTHDYAVQFEFGDPVDIEAAMTAESANDPANAPAPEFIAAFGTLMPPQVGITLADQPTDLLAASAWDYELQYANFDPEVLGDLHDYFSLVKRVNRTIEDFRHLMVGTAVSVGAAELIERRAEQHNEQLAVLRGSNAIDLKNRTRDELIRLQELRDDLVRTMAR